ncbi:hypothetical protein SAMN05216483_4631 [Streptomyces sp. 2131.1]|uniref:hypothetical protein n=1 Tax=Streptomyces sp. 2131.1 TaxID=1855346 RepID=UPI0008954EAD|nr:hypothetical protein [Streptomyces sp. 2131.1]SED82569.1 hypothetical protein SAMN05216483_4631 [Streptomyces sp. 2131.1]
MAQAYYQVNVPIRNSGRPEQRGLHIFTGPADTWSDALRIARETCATATAAQQAGFPLPRRRPDGWGAGSPRPGWVFDWTAATVDAWPYGRTNPATRF